jgi:hypothetical protein
MRDQADGRSGGIVNHRRADQDAAEGPELKGSCPTAFGAPGQNCPRALYCMDKVQQRSVAPDAKEPWHGCDREKKVENDQAL